MYRVSIMLIVTRLHFRWPFQLQRTALGHRLVQPEELAAGNTLNYVSRDPVAKPLETTYCKAPVTDGRIAMATSRQPPWAVSVSPTGHLGNRSRCLTLLLPVLQSGGLNAVYRRSQRMTCRTHTTPSRC